MRSACCALDWETIEKKAKRTIVKETAVGRRCMRGLLVLGAGSVNRCLSAGIGGACEIPKLAWKARRFYLSRSSPTQATRPGLILRRAARAAGMRGTRYSI